jgi:hypothetical protein
MHPAVHQFLFVNRQTTSFLQSALRHSAARQRVELNTDSGGERNVFGVFEILHAMSGYGRW